MRVIELAKSRGLGVQLPRGRELAGEGRVAEVLAGLLDDSYYLIRHFVLPGDPYPLDMVLVGPAGIWQFEILHFAGLVNAEAGWMHWDYKAQGLRAVPYEIISRTGDKVVRLTKYLADQGLPGLEITQVLILSTPNAPRDFTLPGLQVAFLDEVEELVKTAQNLFRPATPVPVAQVVKVLSGEEISRAPASADVPAKRGPQAAPTGLTQTQLLVLLGLGLGAVCLLLAFLAALAYYNFSF